MAARERWQHMGGAGKQPFTSFVPSRDHVAARVPQQAAVRYETGLIFIGLDLVLIFVSVARHTMLILNSSA